jgi:hypothetical protein
MDVLFEQRIVQNEVLAAEVIWQAVQEAFEVGGRVDGVSFPLAFLILPLVFHQRTANVLSNKTQPGAMYKALAEDPEITLGLQERMQSLSTRTLRSLAVAFDAKLIALDREGRQVIFPVRKTPPVIHITSEVKTIMNAAKRVGQSLSEMTPSQLITHLNIRF